MTLEGKTAVITGGASGIGFATAEEFLKGGVSVKVWIFCVNKLKIEYFIILSRKS